MKNTTSTLLIATGALLFGGVATAAFMSSRSQPVAPVVASIPFAEPLAPVAAAPVAGVDDTARADRFILAAAPAYAEVLNVRQVTGKEKIYAAVTGSEAIRESTTLNTPREVCEDVVVEERLPERDGNAGGTLAGALIGGLLGNQVGRGDGRKAATAAGAVAGGLIGNKVDKDHQGGRVVARTERQCRTGSATSESTRVSGYTVTYRNPDGSSATMRMDSKPGSRIALGATDKVLGYDVTYRLDGAEKTVRMDYEPGDRLPVVDGQVVTKTSGTVGNPQG